MRTATVIRAFALCAGVALASAAVADEGFYCNGTIVQEGMNIAKVQQLCGAPTEQTGDRWIYDRGPDQFTIILHIAPDDTISDIEQQPNE